MDTTNWKWFNVAELFRPIKCKCSNATELLTPGSDIAYIGAKKSENGIMAYVERVDSLVTKGNCIVFIGDGQGSVGYCLYQPNDFIGSTTLHAGYHKKLNATNAQFIIAILDCERYRYSFGRKYNKIALNKTNILLPADSKGEPDWQFMEDFVKNTIIPQLPKKAKKVWMQSYDKTAILPQNHTLNVANWHWFRLGDYLSAIYKATAYNFIELQECLSNHKNAIPYITRKDTNNGCKGYVINDDLGQVEERNAITIGDTTSTIDYQDKNFICGDHIVVLRSPYFNKYTALFVVTLLKRERFRYNYGRAFLKDTIANTNLKLPAILQPDGTYTPDWQFMEDYIKSLPYSKNI